MNPEQGVNLETQYAVEQFYYHEASLLDGRKFLTWLKLVDPEISYSLPGRHVPMLDYNQIGKEDMLSVDAELETIESSGMPIRDESYLHLYMRAERSYKRDSWSENPPARTRRIVGNVQVNSAGNDTLGVSSNFHLFYARPGSSEKLYAGLRNDTLKRGESGFIILRREVIMDMDSINYPTLGLFF